MDAMQRSPRPGESQPTGENAFSRARPLSPGARTGLMLVVIAPMAVCYAAVASVTVKRLHPGKEPLSRTGWQLIAGSVVLLGLSAVAEPHGVVPWTGAFVGPLLFLALAGTALRTWRHGERVADFDGRRSSCRA